MKVEYGMDSHFLETKRVQGPQVDESSDFGGQVELHNLIPASRYFYRILFRDHPAHAGPQTGLFITSATGTFQTAPLPTMPLPSVLFSAGILEDKGFVDVLRKGTAFFRQCWTGHPTSLSRTAISFMPIAHARPKGQEAGPMYQAPLLASTTAA